MMWHLPPWPPEIFAFFSGFVLVIGMHYWMAWRVNRTLPKSDQIEARRDNYLQVYRAYKTGSGDKWAPFVSLIRIIIAASGSITILLESVSERAR